MLRLLKKLLAIERGVIESEILATDDDLANEPVECNDSTNRHFKGDNPLKTKSLKRGNVWSDYNEEKDVEAP